MSDEVKKPRAFSLPVNEVKALCEKALVKAEIEYLSVTVPGKTIVVTVKGDDSTASDVAKALVIPGVFGVEGASSREELMDVTELKDAVGVISQTRITLSRAFAEVLEEPEELRPPEPAQEAEEPSGSEENEGGGAGEDED